MRHLMSSMDFSIEELDRLFDLANDIETHMDKYSHACAGKNLPPAFMSQAPVQDSVLNQPCLI